MRAESLGFAMLLAAATVLGAGLVQEHKPAGGGEFALVTTAGLDIINTKAETATYRGHRAVHMIDLPGQIKQGVANGNTIAVLSQTDFNEGTIEVDLAGAPRAGADESARGFVGIAFHVQDGGGRFECFYLRPTNPRSDDQLRRNHATQFTAEPDYPWERLRKEEPGVYESYVDLEPGAWTHLKIEVANGKAHLFVNNAAQPALVINEMKHHGEHGPVALWIGQDTDAYFSKLTIQ